MPSEGNREGKPMVISNLLCNLGCEIERFEDFVSVIRGNIKPKSETGEPREAVLSFHEIYQSLPDVLTQFRERIQKCREELREMLI